MIYTTIVSKTAQHAGKRHGKSKARPKDYDNRQTGKLESVYSPAAVIVIVREVGECCSCRRTNQPLVNNFCPECIVLGGNERQVRSPKEITHRANVARQNSSGSMWRTSRQSKDKGSKRS